ncbi:uncharacterized protein CC84DRAFT_1219671 [Paraphaeosphaeria sporulosa]|uniref:Uncharacterized protein n=1 Tax=Paraphaeosphaeria sporulosa TaxID=1460663 RepID=A0A177C516_9PLEO|nr:uncharacterized protein CC84DRAFT_1219671 [Paraphaeosphaeria sporulosa]OAG02713.1 hypothetical protein CC84DRAFT_1219671 [Paraphaeosphaeria sporulosa]
MSIDMDVELMFDELDYVFAPYLRYVPLPARNDMKTNKSMRQGFSNLFQRFDMVTRTEGAAGLPTEANIRLHIQIESEWPPHCKNYLARGGPIYAIGSWLFEAAMNEDEIAGAGDLMLPDEDCKEEMRNSRLGIEQASLPVCRNDLEYVRGSAVSTTTWIKLHSGATFSVE